jgi:hypothetical protein
MIRRRSIVLRVNAKAHGSFEVNPGGEQNQISECEGKQEQARDGGHGSRPGESGAIEREVEDDARVKTVQPEVIAVFVQHESFHRQLPGQPPFPFGHNGLGRADEASDRVLAGAQLGEEPPASLRARVIRYTKHGAGVRIESGRRASVAGDNVDDDIAVSFVNAGNEIFVESARAALDEQDPGKRRRPARENLSQEVFYQREEGVITPVDDITY